MPTFSPIYSVLKLRNSKTKPGLEPEPNQKPTSSTDNSQGVDRQVDRQTGRHIDRKRIREIERKRDG